MTGTLHHRLVEQPFLFLHHPWLGNERLLVSSIRHFQVGTRQEEGKTECSAVKKPLVARARTKNKFNPQIFFPFFPNAEPGPRLSSIDARIRNTIVGEDTLAPHTHSYT